MRYCLAFALALLLPWVASASWDEAVSAYERKDYVAAYGYLLELADKGELAAQFNLGVMHEQGLGVATDYAEAARWYRKAAEEGYSPAQLNLGNLYRFGRGVEEDHAAAYRWWLSAANLGHPSAQHNVGLQHFLGDVVEKDTREGRRWLNRAVANGSNAAREFLASLDDASDSTTGDEAPDRGPAALDSPAERSAPEPATEAPADTTAPMGEPWILRQAPDRYTLALMAGVNEKAIQAFLARHAFSEPSAYFRFTRGARSWFEAIAGSFADREAAIEALRRLPAGVRKHKPWVTQFRKLHKAIRDRS